MRGGLASALCANISPNPGDDEIAMAKAQYTAGDRDVVIAIGGPALIEDTKLIVEAFRNGSHIFNSGHGITPQADPNNVQRMIDLVRGN